ncbi:MAG TPA: vWA domain-containing protein [Isosphaeraceae bacterium]|jgi:hypothetical protein|nr:vWA domain-containing protein [Isosphaeraceae bacterium]
MILTCELCGEKYVADSAPAGYSARCPSCRGEVSPPPVFAPVVSPPSMIQAPPSTPPPAPVHVLSPPPVPSLPLAAPHPGAKRRFVEIAAAMLIAIATGSALSLALEPAEPALANVPARPLRKGVESRFDVAIDEPPIVRLSHVQEGSLEPLVLAGPAPDDIVSRTLATVPMAHVSGLMANASTPELSGAVLVPIGGAQGRLGERIELGSLLGGGTINDGSWASMLQDLRLHGLDIIIVFDSTGSMSGEIAQVKAQVEQIGTTLKQLIPKTRIGMCAYRDYGDEYVVKGLPLTDDIRTVVSFLEPIQAGGGGDEPEAVVQGLRWAVTMNKFRPSARKVILIFGDAPPHPAEASQCLAIAGDFHRKQKGIVSTVTCKHVDLIPDFVHIAEAGGGEAFFTTDQKKIMEQLIILVFGSRHRDKVLEAFKLMRR